MDAALLGKSVTPQELTGTSRTRCQPEPRSRLAAGIVFLAQTFSALLVDFVGNPRPSAQSVLGWYRRSQRVTGDADENFQRGFLV